MKLTEAIWRYQYENDRGLTARIRQSMNLDHLASRRRLGRPPEPEERVALRCLRLLAKPLAAIPARLAACGVDPEREDPARVFEEYAEPVREATGIVLTVHNYERHADALRDYLGAAYPPLFAAYQRLIGVKPTVVQLLASRIVERYWVVLGRALEDAAAACDLGVVRTDTEAAVFLGREIRRRCTGMLRFEEAPAPAAGPFVEPAYFGAAYAILGAADVPYDRLSPGQRRLIERIKALVEEDAAELRFDDYDVDESGGYRIRCRCAARRLCVAEERLGRALQAVRRALAPDAAAAAGRR